MSNYYDQRMAHFNRAQAEYDRAEPPSDDDAPMTFEEMNCTGTGSLDDLKPYCPWDGPAVTGGPDGPISCDGMFCEQAYERYLEMETAHDTKP